MASRTDPPNSTESAMNDVERNVVAKPEVLAISVVLCLIFIAPCHCFFFISTPDIFLVSDNDSYRIVNTRTGWLVVSGILHIAYYM